jgi:hypothetical protein
MRHTRSHTKNRRSHHALKGARVSTTEAGVKHPRHKALLDGTPYRGRSVTKVKAVKATKPTVANKKPAAKKKAIPKKEKRS